MGHAAVLQACSPGRLRHPCPPCFSAALTQYRHLAFAPLSAVVRIIFEMESAENFSRTTGPKLRPSRVTGLPPRTLGQLTVAVRQTTWNETAQFAPRLT